MDLFDHKPELSKRHGQPHPEQVETFQLANKNVLLGTPFQFARYGQSGMEFSEIMPHLGSVADDLCLVRSMFTENNNHPFALNMLQTGKTFTGRPAMGSWIGYALGSENQDLPGYIVLRDPAGYNTSGKMVWSSGWLPAIYQGTEFSFVGNPGAAPAALAADLARRPSRDRGIFWRSSMRSIWQSIRASRNWKPGSRTSSWRRGCNWRPPTCSTCRSETEATRNLYGLDNPATAGYGARCLIARRLVESGVRFVQIFPPLDPSFQPWDTHSNLQNDLRKICDHVDQPKRRADRRPEAARPAGRRDRDVDRRVRPAADHRGGRRPRPQPARLQPADGRRRVQARPHPRRDRRVRL